MKTKFSVLFMAILASVGCLTHAQTYDTNGDYVETFAGSGFSGYLDGTGQLTMFDSPNAIVADSSSNLFVWDSSNYRIRKITPSGTVTTFAGGGSVIQGTGTNVQFGYSLNNMTIDQSNTLWASSAGTSWLYKITSGAVVTYTNLSSILGNANGINGICADSHGNIYLSSGSGNQIIRYTTNKVASVFAGSGNTGSADGNGIFTSFYRPAALAADSANNIGKLPRSQN
jgi:streptogramin lyase